MDEVDNIIIETLRALNCNIPPEISCLKNFNDDLVVQSIVSCLEAIIPSSKFPKKLSPSMAVRLKTASHLAEQIKDIGFKDEIGYQTILYFNEVEIRRLLIFLIEKLPRDTSNSIQTEEIGYIPKLLAVLKQIMKNVPILWIPSAILDRGIHGQGDNLEVRSYGNSCNLKIKKLLMPCSKDNIKFKNFFVHILPTITKQCKPHQLIPSLLFEDCRFSKRNKDMLTYLRNVPIIGRTDEPSFETLDKESIQETKNEVENKTSGDYSPVENIRSEPDTMQSLSERLEIEEEKYMQLKKMIDKEQMLIKKLKETEEKEMKDLEESTDRLKIKTKTMAILNQEENRQRLELLVEKARCRLVELANQWEEIQGPLLAEYQALQSSLSKNVSFQREKENIMKHSISVYEELLKDLKDKLELEQKLVEKHKECWKNSNRSTYTKNIMEIIGNIKKQKQEMQKILIDTRKVQKDINSLTGQIDRSFTISDELIFSNAMRDETSRKAYKLLVSLHEECSEIIKIISNIGFLERECRNLQELVDIETAKETSVKFKRLNEDLKQIEEENMNLLKQLQ